MIPGTLGHATIRKTRGLHWHNSHSDNIEQSMWFDGSSQYLTRQNSADFVNRKEAIVSFWVKRNRFDTQSAVLGCVESGNGFILQFENTNKFWIYQNGTNDYKTTAVFRDYGWYHILVSWDTSQADQNIRTLLYVNGTAIDSFSSITPLSQDANIPGLSGQMTSTEVMRVGVYNNGVGNYYYTKDYLTQVCLLESKSIQQGDHTISDFLDTWPFGNNGSQFVPKKTSDITPLVNSAGGQSFLLDFADSSALGNDISSNNNDFTDAGSPGAANQTTNTPSREYQTFNPLVKSQNGFTLTNGNTKANLPSGGGFIPLTKLIQGNEKVYVEFVADDANNGNWGIGVANDGVDSDGAFRQSGIIAWESDGDKYVDASQTATDVRAWADGAVMALALDMQNRKLWIRDSTGWQGSGGSDDPTDSSTGVALPASIGDSAVIIFGNSAGSFDQDCELKTEANSALTYAIPAGFKTLSTKDGNEPEYQGIDYFDSTLYEGTGGGQRVGDFVPFTDAYTVSKSLIFNDNDSAYLNKTPSSAGNRRTWTFSCWFKRGNIIGGNCPLFSAGGDDWIMFLSGDTLGTNSDGSNNYRIVTNRVFKDSSSWHNLVVAWDTTNSTAGDRIRMYVDGVEQTSFGTDTNAALNYETNFSNTNEHSIGKLVGSSTFFDGYMAEVVFIDGQQLGPSSFGQTDTSTNRWVPKDVSGLTFGTNGFYLDMAIAPGTGNGPGNDVSGNNNDYTVNAFAAGDQSNDTPSNNHAVLDSQDTIGSATPTLSEGNTRMVGNDNGGRYVSGFPLTSGKWYWEVEVTTGIAFYPGFFTPAGIAYASSTPWNSNSGSFLVNGINGHWLGANGSGTAILYSGSGGPGAFISNGDRIFFAYDADNKYAYLGEVGSGGSGSTLTYYTYGGTASADPTNDSGFGAAPFGLHLTGEDTFYFGAVSGSNSDDATFLFDSTKWNGTPPTGYKALTQDNKDGADDKITAWAWIKNRDSSDSHILVDRVRGVGQTLNADDESIETTEVNTVQRFLQRGVQVGNDVQVNTVNESYVLWQWLAGTSAGTGSVTSPAGALTSNTVVSTPGNFSVGTYTGTGSATTVGHGLGGAPELIFIKNRSSGSTSTSDWVVGTEYLGLSVTDPWTDYAHLDTSGNFADNNTKWNDTAPTANVFTIGTNNRVNKASDNYVFYAFRSIPGVCKVGSYVGNGSTSDGPYIYTGFTPRWIFIKNTGATQNWMIWDTARSPYNQLNHTLWADINSGESTSSTYGRDILSNGFKLRGSSHAIVNANGNNYLYMAMAEIAPNGAYPPIYGR